MGPSNGALQQKEMKAVSVKQEAVVLMTKPKFIQHRYGIIPYMFDCGADPIVHLLLLRRSMAELDTFQRYFSQELLQVRNKATEKGFSLVQFKNETTIRTLLKKTVETRKYEVLGRGSAVTACDSRGSGFEAWQRQLIKTFI